MDWVFFHFLIVSFHVIKDRLLAGIAKALRRDRYDGVISFESVYHPGNGDFEAGFRDSIELFKDVFGEAVE